MSKLRHGSHLLTAFVVLLTGCAEIDRLTQESSDISRAQESHASQLGRLEAEINTLKKQVRQIQEKTDRFDVIATDTSVILKPVHRATDTEGSSSSPPI